MSENHLSSPESKRKAGSLLLILVFIFLCLAIIAGSAFYYYHYEKKFRDRAEAQLSAIAELKVNELVEWRKERLVDASFFLRNGNFEGLVKQYITNPGDGDARERLFTWLAKLKAIPHYDRVFLLDTLGREYLSLPDQHDTIAAHIPDDVGRALRSRNVSFLDFHRDAPDKPIHLTLMVPLFDEKDNNRPLAVLVLRIDPHVYLYPFIQNWPVTGKTSETLIARREGNFALFLNELKFDKNTALRLKIPLSKTETPVVQAVLGYKGVMEGIDYRGEPVLAAVRDVPESPWFLVARMDIAEVYAPLRERLWQTVIFIAFILAGLGSTLFLLLRQLRLEKYREQIKAAEALRESEEKFRNVFDNSAIGKSITALDGTVNVNLAFCEMLGYTMDELARTKWQNLSHPDDYESTQKHIKQLLSGEKRSARFLKRYFKKDGSIIWADLSTVLQKDKDGMPLFYITSVLDITERLKATEQLEATCTLLNALINSPRDIVIFSLDNEYRYTAYNDKHREEMKKAWAAEIKLGDCILDFMVIPELRTLARASMDRALQGERFTEIQHQPNLDIYYEFLWNPVDLGKKTIGATCFIRDITGRKQAEESLKKSEEKYRALFETMSEGIVYEDHEGRIVSANPAAERLLGLSFDQMQGRTSVDPRWKALHEDGSPFPGETHSLHIAAKTGKPATGEIMGIYNPKLDAYVWLSVNSTPEFLPGGKEPFRAYAVFRDISDRKRLEEKLQHYTAQLEQKTRDLEQLIYVTSHDLRSPLVNVQGFAKELARSAAELMEAVQAGDILAEAARRIGPILKKDIPESLEYIQSGIVRMDMQLSALLKLSRLGRTAVTAAKIDMNGLVAEVVNTLEFVVKEKNAEIHVAELPPCMADTAQVNQIFLNLIDNAVKYLDSGRPGSIQIKGTRENGGTVYCVEDNGIGIAPEYKEKIFEIFYRVEQGPSPGEGLGLTIVRQCAEKLNGSVWVESEPGKGSRFFVKLPGV